MNEIQRSKIILRILNKIYPKTPIPLKHRNKFTLLVSVLLSAQTTDVNVNNVTKNIYPKYNKPEHFVKLGRKKIERLIKSIGIFRVKAKSVYFLSKQLIEMKSFRNIWVFIEFQDDLDGSIPLRNGLRNAVEVATPVLMVHKGARVI